uniref:CHCH domain-containing protein n=1 Tax=Rhabditophanes sp. KR3021 TaxID=114890 RepID=A0AC35UC61_9BILA
MSKSSFDNSLIKISDKDAVYLMTKDKFYSEITNEYAKKVSMMAPDDLFSKYNPGPTNPDGTPNFECHCVSHLVASPCGYAFRDLLSCQKKQSKIEFEDGACTTQFMEFMRCVMDTGCFKSNNE